MSSITHIKNVYWKRLAVVATATANVGKRLLKQPADAVSALGRRAKPGTLTTIGLLLFFLIVSPLPAPESSLSFGISDTYSALWGIKEEYRRYDGFQQKMIRGSLKLSGGVQLNESGSSRIGMTISIYYNRHASPKYSFYTYTDWWDLKTTKNNYRSYKSSRNLLIYSGSTQKNFYTAALAADWENSYSADSGYGPFVAVVDAEYENMDSEGEGMETYQTMRHEADMGYESKGRLTWIPPSQTSTVSLDEKTGLVSADDDNE